MSRSTKLSMPFLYPTFALSQSTRRNALSTVSLLNRQRKHLSTQLTHSDDVQHDSAHLTPSPEDFSRNIFADKAQVTIYAGSGGHGCVSFLREKYIEEGPPNGGDGGYGGSIYIQAVSQERSLHKLARRRFIKAGKGKNGKGKSQGGQRGEDVLIQVPVGTIVKETSRDDPLVEAERWMEDRRVGKRYRREKTGDDPTGRMEKWLVHPRTTKTAMANIDLPDEAPYPRRSNLSAAEPVAPINLDLSRPMTQPMLLLAGAIGGLGNPHFQSNTHQRPILATKGEEGTSVKLEFELKLLADLGFVGMPNAGKSTLLRALSRSQARVGDWAFTTLHPNIGTMILDTGAGRPKVPAVDSDGKPRLSVSIADIPGLVEDAHLDKGLGLGFLRHIERAQVLAFVIDLTAGDPIKELNSLWRELRKFEGQTEDQQPREQEQSGMVTWSPDLGINDEAIITLPDGSDHSRRSNTSPISGKPWFVVATKGDIPGTEERFASLQSYLESLDRSSVEKLCGSQNAWEGDVIAIPVSAIEGQGIERIPEWTAELLEQCR